MFAASMRRQFQILALLLAWLFANGAQWDLVQVFAWGRMFADYSRIMPLTSALRMTFKPENMCDVCRLVKEAKQRQQQSSAISEKDTKKLVLVFEAVQQMMAPCALPLSWSHSDQDPTGIHRNAPLLPPPRVLAV